MLTYNDNKNEYDKKHGEKSELTDEKNHALESLSIELKEMSDQCCKWLDPWDYKIT